MKPGKTGITRIVDATGYSMSGIRAAWKNEAAFRQEAVIAALMLPAAFWIGSTVVEYVLLVGCLFIVLITELLNSAIEAIVDRVGTEHHELSGQSKDMASAAVLFSLLLTAFVWGAIAWQNLL